ncbi:MAG: toll/interleukin-1 receptor domain-containing protein [Chloroflexota bacterium]|nr:toll/interleukin-1 receptor domain-containing protein [Chloroflexota bacterium]
MKVFISHTQHDDVLARKIADALQESGLDVWDDRYIMPGDNWAEKVSQALEESQAMVVLISPEALQSKWVRREIEYALGKKDYSRKLIPVFVGPRDSIPEEKVPWILRRLKTIELSDLQEQEEGIRQIRETLLKAS